MAEPDIQFVHLGITIEHLRNNISVFGFSIAYYGIIIGIGMLVGIWVAQQDAKRRKQDSEIYLDFALYAIVFAIIGARIYYVIFEWDYYSKHLMQIFNLRAGGLAIYGGVIAAVITLAVYARTHDYAFLSMADTGVLGLITGQIIGRWGNFFNCEAYGTYTDSLFAMRIRRDLARGGMNEEILNHIVRIGNAEYIQVHPTFLYESLWNLAVLCFMMWYRKRKKFNGEMLLIYLFGYGLGRVWIEGLRTDQLRISGTQIAVSQVLSLVLVVVSAYLFVWQHLRMQKAGKQEKEN